MNIRFSILSALACATVTMSASANDGHVPARRYPSTIPVGNKLPSLSAMPLTGTVIVVRYLGYSCLHCVRQLTYLNQHAEALHKAGIRVIAVSEDNLETSRKLQERMNYHPEVFTFVSDPQNVIAASIGAIRTENDTLLDLHASMVLHDGVVRFSTISNEPFMDVTMLIQHAVRSAGVEHAGSSDDRLLRNYIGATVTPKIVAGPANGIVNPVDLDFDRSVLHPNDLWVVTTENGAAGMAIIHNANTERQTIRLKTDAAASHFMYRTQGIAFSDNGTFATAQSGWPGEGRPNYMFMGPTLWSSDTAIFASAYQNNRDYLASHLDMLHQSPWCMGIANESESVYWVSDARYKDVVRYDFADPHEVGGTDHRDGVIRRFSNVSITPVDRNTPAHLAFDRERSMLYIVDPGGKRILRLDVRTGSYARDLTMPDESAENVREFSEYTGASVETVISEGLSMPVGIDVKGDRLIVGDRASGVISMYDLKGALPTLMGTISTGATALAGITIGPDNHIWYTDQATATVVRLETAGTSGIVQSDNIVLATPSSATTRIRLSNGSSQSQTFSLESQSSDWTASWNTPTHVVAPNSVLDVDVLLDYATAGSPPKPGNVTIRAVAVDNETIPPTVASITVVPSNLRRVIVDDAPTEEFSITNAVALTERRGYVALSTTVFNTVVDQLDSIETVLWFSGSFGDVNPTDEAVLVGLRENDVDVFLIADDALARRFEDDPSLTLLGSFGTRFFGVDVPNDEGDGRRVLDGTVGDPVTGGMNRIDCQLPRLNHHRGSNYVPNIALRTSSSGSASILRNRTTNNVIATRYMSTDTLSRSIVLGINPQRMLNDQERTMILDRGLAWLEAGAPVVVPEDPTSVASSETKNQTGLSIRAMTNPVQTSTEIIVDAQKPTSSPVTISVHSVSGQTMTTLYTGFIEESLVIPMDVSAYAQGTYFVIARTGSGVAHYSLVVKR